MCWNRVPPPSRGSGSGRALAGIAPPPPQLASGRNGKRPGNDGDPLFTSIRGGRLSRDAVERIVQKYTALATEVCPSLKDKRVTPHVLRHAAAMTLLQSGVDCAVIALWLGHESIETTQIYLHADLQLKVIRPSAGCVTPTPPLLDARSGAPPMVVPDRGCRRTPEHERAETRRGSGHLPRPWPG